MWKTACIAVCLIPALPAGYPGSARSETPPPVVLQEKQAPSTPLAEQKAALGDDDTWDPAWDKVVEEALPSEFLYSNKIAKDVKGFCPRFKHMSEADKRAYWAYFFQALAGAEAGLRATANVRHTEPEVAVKDDVTHRMVRSEGLLQLTYEDAERYGCDFDWEHDKELSERDPQKTILQPSNNLLCGVKILSAQLIDRNKPLRSKASYWSVLRPGWPGSNGFLDQMANVPSACGMPRAHRKRTKDLNTASTTLNQSTEQPAPASQ